MYRFALLILLAVISCFPAWSQRQQPRDPQALGLLSGLRSVMGGAILAATQDTVATAEVLIIQDGTPVKHQVTFKTLGRDGVRIEADTTEGQSVFVMDSRRASSQTSGDEAQKYPRMSFGAIGVPHLPLLSIVSDLADASIRAEYIGLEESDVGEFHHVRLQKSFSRDEGLGELDAPLEVFIDPRTQLPARIIYSLRSPENLRVAIPVEIRLSDYRSFNGIAVPFRVVHYIRGQVLAEYTFLSFDVNQGAKPSDFEVKP